MPLVPKYRYQYSMSDYKKAELPIAAPLFRLESGRF